MAWAHDAKLVAVGNHACVMIDSDVRIDRVYPRSGGHSNRSPRVKQSVSVNFKVGHFE